MAAMALLDGEPGSLTSEQVDAHVAGCDGCHGALAGLRTLHAHLNRVDYSDHLDVDLWPVIHQHVASGSPRQALRESGAIIGLTAVLCAWRLAQLLLDLPAPVVNSVVPLAMIVVVLWHFTGDPFAIRVSSHQLQGGGAS